MEGKSVPMRLGDLTSVVISGPSHPATHLRDTSAVFRELIETTQEELILVSYALHNGKEIFEPLVARQKLHPDLAIHLMLDIPRTKGDTTLSDQLVARYRRKLLSEQWPGDLPPKLYYFTPSLDLDWRLRASMHAKVIISDRRRVFITSANLTKAAQQKNIEAGIVIDDPSTAQQVASYFFGLIEQGDFKPL